MHGRVSSSKRGNSDFAVMGISITRAPINKDTQANTMKSTSGLTKGVRCVSVIFAGLDRYPID